MARLFNGTSDLIAADAAHITNPGTTWSLAMWVNSSLANANAKDIYGEGNTVTANTVFQLQGTAAGKVQAGFRDDAHSGALSTLTSTATLFDATWHPFAITQTAANLVSIYIDGLFDSSFTLGAAATGATTFTKTTLGALVRTTTTNFYGGTLAHVASWSRTLSAAEIASLASGARPSVVGPDHYWPLVGRDSPEPDCGAAAAVAGTLTGTARADGPVATDLASFIASLGRRPVPMIQGPDSDRIAGMRGRFK